MSVLTLGDARTHLNVTSGTHDVELQEFIDSAEAAIAKKCGPLAPTAVTETVRGGGSTLVLNTTPAISLTSVTPSDAAALTLSDLYLDGRSGVVEWVSGGSFGSRRYTVVYSAGRTTCPDDLLMGVKELVRILWDASQRGPGRRPGSSSTEGYSNTLPGAANELPFLVTQKISDHIQVGIG